MISNRRFTGPALNVTTDSGDIRVASSYADESKFSSNTGSMNLRNLHNENFIAVYEQGDVNAQGIDGSANIFVIQTATLKLMNFTTTHIQLSKRCIMMIQLTQTCTQKPNFSSLL